MLQGHPLSLHPFSRLEAPSSPFLYPVCSPHTVLGDSSRVPMRRGAAPICRKNSPPPLLPTGSLSGSHFLKALTTPHFYPSFIFFHFVAFTPDSTTSALKGVAFDLPVAKSTDLPCPPPSGPPSSIGHPHSLGFGRGPSGLSPSGLLVLCVQPSLPNLSGLHPGLRLSPPPHSLGFSIESGCL